MKTHLLHTNIERKEVKMKISENVKTLIEDYAYYLKYNDDAEKNPDTALRTITVVERKTNEFYHVIGIEHFCQTNVVTINLESNKPHDKSADRYASVNGDEFDDRFQLLVEFEKVLLNITIAEMNREIFTFIHPYFITYTRDWSFDISAKGCKISIKFWGSYPEDDSYDKLVINIHTINDVSIKLYGRNGTTSVDVFKYKSGSVTIAPVATYGPLSVDDIHALCDKVEEIIRRNSYER